MREARLSVGLEAWQSSKTNSSEASESVSGAGLSFSFSCSDDLLCGDDAELTAEVLSESALSDLTDFRLSSRAPLMGRISEPVLPSWVSFKASWNRFTPRITQSVANQTDREDEDQIKKLFKNIETIIDK